MAILGLLKNWYRGKPLRELDSNSGLAVWSRGEPISVVGYISGGSVLILPSAALSTAVTLQTPSVVYTCTITPAALPLTASLLSIGTVANVLVAVDVPLSISSSLSEPEIKISQGVHQLTLGLSSPQVNLDYKLSLGDARTLAFSILEPTINLEVGIRLEQWWQDIAWTQLAPTVSTGNAAKFIAPSALAINWSTLAPTISEIKSVTVTFLSDITGTHNGAAGAYFLTDTTRNFYALGVRPGQIVYNTTKESRAIIWGIGSTTNQYDTLYHDTLRGWKSEDDTEKWHWDSANAYLLVDTAGMVSNTGAYSLFPIDDLGNMQQGWLFHDTVDISSLITYGNAWSPVDIRTIVPPGTQALLLHLQNTRANADYTCAVRNYWSTEDRSSTTKIRRSSHQWKIVTLYNPDFSTAFETYIANSYVKVSIVARHGHSGWFASGQDRSLGSTGSYLTVNLNPAGTTAYVNKVSTKAAYLHVHNSGASNYAYGIRRPDHNYDYNYNQYTNQESLSVVGVNTSKEFQEKIANTAMDTYLYGFAGSECEILSGGPQLVPCITYNAWTDMSISSFVTAGHEPTGAILQIINPSAGDLATNVRKNGDVNGWTTSINVLAGTHIFAMVGVDANKMFEAYAASGTSIYLVGYFRKVVLPRSLSMSYTLPAPTIVVPTTNNWYFPTEYRYSLSAVIPVGATGNWVESRYSPAWDGPVYRAGYGSSCYIPRNAKAVIGQFCMSSIYTQDEGVRPIGSSYDRRGRTYYGSQTWSMVKVTDCRFEYDRGSYGGSFKVVGWTTDDICYDPVDHSTSTVGSYVTTTASEIPSGSDCVFLLFNNIAALTWYHAFAENPNDVTSDTIAYLTAGPGQEWWPCSVNASKQFRQYIGNVDVDCFAVGYEKMGAHMYIGSAADPIPSVNVGSTTNWQTIDCSAVVDSDACGVVVKFYNNDGTNQWACNLRTHNLPATETTGYCQTHANVIGAVGLDENMYFDVQAVGATVQVKLLGYFRGHRKVTLYTNPWPLNVSLSTPVLPEVRVWSGWTFPTNMINIFSRISAAGSWVTVNLGTYNDVPTGTKAVILHAVRKYWHSVFQGDFGYTEITSFRPCGSTYNQLCYQDGGHNEDYYVKLDENRCFQAYIQDITSNHLRLFVRAFTDTDHGLTYPQQMQIQPPYPSRWGWKVIDMSSQYPKATGLFFEQWHPVTGGGPCFALRMPGDSIVPTSDLGGNTSVHQCAVGSLDGERKFELETYQAQTCYMNVWGYLDSSEYIPFFFPPFITVNTSGTWVDIDCSGLVPADAVGVVLHNINSYETILLRKNGSSDSYTYAYDAHHHVVGLDQNRIFEMQYSYADDTVGLFLAGYFRGFPGQGGARYFPEVLTLTASLQTINVQTVTCVHGEFPLGLHAGLSAPGISTQAHLGMPVKTAQFTFPTPTVLASGIQPVEVVFSLPEPEVSIGVSVTVEPLPIEGTFNIFDPETGTGFQAELLSVTITTLEPIVPVAVSALTVTISLLSPNIICEALVTLGAAQTDVFSLISPYIPDVLLGLGNLNATFNLSNPSVVLVSTLVPDPVTAVFSLPDPLVRIVFQINETLDVDVELNELQEVYVEVAPWTFPTTWINANYKFTRDYNWTVCDLSTVLPEGVQAVIIHVCNPYSGGPFASARFQVRPRYCGENRANTASIMSNGHAWYFVQLTNRQFEIYCPVSTVDVRVVGYSTDNVFRSSSLDRTPEFQTLTWTDAAFTGAELIADARAVVFERAVPAGVIGGIPPRWDARKKGLHITRDYCRDGHGQFGTHSLVALNSSKVCEIRCESMQWYAWGALGEDCQMFDVPIELEASSLDTWVTIDTSGYVDDEAIAVILNLYGDPGGGVAMVRKMGSGDFEDATLRGSCTVETYQYITAVVGLDTLKQLQVYISSSIYGTPGLALGRIQLVGQILGGSRQFAAPCLDIGANIDFNFVGEPNIKYAAPCLSMYFEALDPTVIATFDTLLFSHAFDNDDYACSLVYSFTSDVSITERGAEKRFGTYSMPKREATVTLGDLDSSIYFELQKAVKVGTSMSSVPLWTFKTPLIANASIDDNSVRVADVSEFGVNEGALISQDIDQGSCDLLDITSIAGSTLNASNVLTHDYHIPSVTGNIMDVLSAHVAPCITGSIELEDDDLLGDATLFRVKVKVTGGAWQSAIIPTSVDPYLVMPASMDNTNAQLEREILGVDTGTLSLHSYEDSSRLVFSLEWHFTDNSWKDLRSLFFWARGRMNGFNLPTWQGELRVQAPAVAGDIEIKLNEGFEMISSRYNTILVVPRYGDPFTMDLGDHLGNGVFECKEQLPVALYGGEYVSFCPYVRFSEDQITFEFSGPDMCVVKATFVEVHSD